MERLVRRELGRVARFVVLVLVVVALIALSASGVFASARDVAGKVERIVRSDDRERVQSSAQLSQFEFNRLTAGTSEARLRALVGDPASRQAAKVEGIAIECWYYGVAGTTGAYQFCFQNGRLRTKARYTAWPAPPS
jgi:hypothetical protein